MFDKIRNRALDDHHRDDIYEDHIYNYEQILVINIIKILRQFLRILIIAYYIGQYWYVFASTFHDFYHDYMHHEEGTEFSVY